MSQLIKELFELPKYKTLIVEYRDIPDNCKTVILPDKKIFGKYENASILEEDEKYIVVAALAGSCAIALLYEKSKEGIRRVIK